MKLPSRESDQWQKPCTHCTWFYDSSTFDSSVSFFFYVSSNVGRWGFACSAQTHTHIKAGAWNAMQCNGFDNGFDLRIASRKCICCDSIGPSSLDHYLNVFANFVARTHKMYNITNEHKMLAASRLHISVEGKILISQFNDILRHPKKKNELQQSFITFWTWSEMMKQPNWKFHSDRKLNEYHVCNLKSCGHKIKRDEWKKKNRNCT